MHRIEVGKDDGILTFSVELRAPIDNQTGPGAQQRDLSDRGKDDF
jgi:hypothetical protein